MVQLRRFLVPQRSGRPNLASQCLGLGLRALPGEWVAQHGYRPLLAESFSDPESHHGTVYKATNWTCAGDTKGFSQDHTDYYLPNERPKKLWLKPLDARAYDLMNALDPHAHTHALTAWLQANSGILPRSLALDGKSVGDGKCGMIVTLCRHEDGRPVAMIPATGKKKTARSAKGAPFSPMRKLGWKTPSSPPPTHQRGAESCPDPQRAAGHHSVR